MNDAVPDLVRADERRGTRRRLWAKIAVGLALIGVAVWLGRDLSEHFTAVEEWVAAQGIWAYIVFVAGVVLLTSLFIPDTLFALFAGALFGVVVGTIVMTVGCLMTAAFNYTVGRLLMRDTAQGVLERSPRLAAIARAVQGEGLRFQFLLRLTPINPVTVNYLLGATNVHFPTFLVGCLGLVPSIFVEVYFGHVAKHAALVSGGADTHSTLHTMLTFGGLLLCLLLLLYIVRIARRALAEYQVAESSPA